VHDNVRPISEKRLAANRANALKSTGPRTPEGRARSAQNARKHGFAASKFTIIRVEDAQDLENLKADCVDTYQPVNSQELYALERIALAQFSMLRAAQFEAGVFTSFVNDGLIQEDNLHSEVLRDGLRPGQGAAFVMAEGLQRQCQRSKGIDFSLFLRYKAQVERDYRRAVEEFERLRKLRDELTPKEPIEEIQPEQEPDPNGAAAPRSAPDFACQPETPSEPSPSRGSDGAGFSSQNEPVGENEPAAPPSEPTSAYRPDTSGPVHC
jgi:hypothetical protein